MITVSLNNQKLDLYKNTTIQYVLNSPAFVGGDIDKFNGTYSLPFSIPLSKRNRIILNFPDRLDNNDFLLTDVPCEIAFDTKPLFSGLATVKKPSVSRGSKNCTIYVVQDSYKTFKEKKLSDLPLGYQNFITVDRLLDHAKETAHNHLDHTYTFFPVRNPRMTDDFEIQGNSNAFHTAPHKYINYYDTANQEFVNSPDQRSASPFARLDYLIEKIGELSGIAFVNNFATTDELKSLYLYGDTNLYTTTDDESNTDPSSWPSDLDLSQHVPKMKISEFLKEFAKLFCLGLFPNKKTIEIIPLKQILAAPYQQDWTKYADEAYNQDTKRDYPSELAYESPGDELFQDHKYEDLSVTEYDKRIDIPNSAPDGIYYIKSKNIYVRKSGTKIVFKRRMFRRESVHPDGTEYLLKAAPLFMTHTSGTLRTVPEIYSPPSSVTSLRVVFYRGMQANGLGQPYPFATNHTTGPTQDPIPGALHSLLWNAPAGMMLWWSAWADFLRNKKNIFRIMHLPIREILNMRFQNKVKIENKHYLVKQLKVTLTMKGVKPSNCEFVSVL